MTHLYKITEPEPWAEKVLEETDVLLVPAYPLPTDEVKQVRVFVPIGYLKDSQALATRLDQAIRGSVWATLTRNDGHYIEVTADNPEDTDAPRNPST